MNNRQQQLSVLRADILKSVTTGEADVEFNVSDEKVSFITATFSEIRSELGHTLKVSTYLQGDKLFDPSLQVCPLLNIHVEGLPVIDCRQFFWKEKDILSDIRDAILARLRDAYARTQCKNWLRGISETPVDTVPLESLYMMWCLKD